jgi:hypothetical protein
MIFKTDYFIEKETMVNAINSIPLIDFKLSINHPTGDFFYDNWTINDNFKDSIWDQILKSLPINTGEARLILLKPGQAYQTHADIDDRYHLNISGNNSYLINLDQKEMFETKNDNYWYYMSTSHRHTAANFGYVDRIQLVVRNLLIRNFLNDSISIAIFPVIKNLDRARYIFDDQLSPWLNISNKNGIINNFRHVDSIVYFDIDNGSINSLLKILPNEFRIEYK